MKHYARYGVLIAVLFFIGINVTILGYYNKQNDDDRRLSDLCPNGLSDNTEDLLCKKPLVFDERYKNPCWYDNTDNLHCLPYFILFGMQKCGSTDLYDAIMRHPEVVMPSTIKHQYTTNKEFAFFNLFHFDNSSLFMSFNNYTDRFQPLSKKLENDDKTLITGEGTGDYLWRFSRWQRYPQNHNQTIPRFLLPDLVRHIIPSVKLVAMLRDPTERTLSAYKFFHSEIKDEKLLLEEFRREIKEEMHYLRACMFKYGERNCLLKESTLESIGGKHADEHRYVSPSLYVVFYKEWLRVFPRNQILLLDFDFYKSNKTAVLRQVFQFLGLRQISYMEMKNLQMIGKTIQNKGRKTSKTAIKKTLSMLQQFYKPYNERFCEMVNYPFEWC